MTARAGRARAVVLQHGPVVVTLPSLRRDAWRALPRRVTAAFTSALILGASVSCGGDGPSGPSKPTTGALQVSVSGLPTSVQPLVTVSGPGMSAHQVLASETLTAIPPGTYTIAANEVSTTETIWAPGQRSQQVVVAAGSTPASASVSYAVASGALTVTITGLPDGANADVVVSAGDGSFMQHLSATTTLPRLRSGTYTLSATPVTQGATTYYVATVPETQAITVTPGGTTSAQVEFRAPSGANLAVAGLYVVQSVQRVDPTGRLPGTVPLVQGRAGLLRVFVRASEAQVPAPAVRVRLYNGGQVVLDQKIAAPMTYAPTTEASAGEGSLAGSWNVALPASLLQPGLSITAQVDPDDVVHEGNEADNLFPLNGQPLDAGVRSVPPLRLRFVPIYQSANGLTGDVSASNVERYLATTRKLHPIDAVDADVRAPYTTSQAPLNADDTDKGWERVLQEIDAARDVDPDGASRTYYGVVKVTYTSGIAGLGYIEYPVAMGWDYLPSGSEVMAHELGHTWGRHHAPCGVDDGDASYPYAGGQIGAYGYDATTGALKRPTTPDIMGYCSGKWISDYTYSGVLAYRAAHGVTSSADAAGVTAGVAPGATAADATAARGPVQRCLLVWGRVSDRGVTLEPAFEVDTRPSLPQGGGPLTLSATSASGGALWSFSFEGTAIADSPTHTRTFSFAIPIARARPSEIAALRLAAPSGEATSRVTTSPATPGAGEVSVARTARPRWVRVRWNAALNPVVMVRDPRTGAVLSFARGGDAEVRTPDDSPASVDVLLSNRVRSVQRRVTVEKQ